MSALVSGHVRALEVKVLDTVTGTWTTAEPLPIARCAHQCVALGSLLYVVGGVDDNDE